MPSTSRCWDEEEPRNFRTQSLWEMLRGATLPQERTSRREYEARLRLTISSTIIYMHLRVLIMIDLPSGLREQL